MTDTPPADRPLTNYDLLSLGVNAAFNVGGHPFFRAQSSSGPAYISPDANVTLRRTGFGWGWARGNEMACVECDFSAPQDAAAAALAQAEG